MILRAYQKNWPTTFQVPLVLLGIKRPIDTNNLTGGELILLVGRIMPLRLCPSYLKPKPNSHPLTSPATHLRLTPDQARVLIYRLFTLPKYMCAFNSGSHPCFVVFDPHMEFIQYN